MKKTFGILAAVVVMSILSVTAKADPVIGQVDTFQTGPLGWLVGFGAGPAPRTPLTTLSGGPAGAGDNYLLISGTGVREPFGSVSALNDAQWAGNYLAAGVNAINDGREELRPLGPLPQAAGGRPLRSDGASREHRLHDRRHLRLGGE